MGHNTNFISYNCKIEKMRVICKLKEMLKYKRRKTKAKNSFGLQKARVHVGENEREPREGREGRRRKTRRRSRYGILYFGFFCMNSHGELMLLGLGFWKRSPKP